MASTTPAHVDTSTPDAAPGSGRQARMLALRKAGFKAKDLPTATMTPKKTGSWSRANSSSTLISQLAEDDNTSIKPETPSTHSILREISNSSRLRKKQSRTRIDESIFIFQDENAVASPKVIPIELHCVPEGLSQSHCASPRSAARSRSNSKATPASRIRRHSINIDAAKYIEHLESELAAAQTQLASMTSPTVLQARSLKMRALNAETRALHDEVAEWEHKFHDRVQEEIEERSKIEAALKARIRLLEGDTEDYSQKIKELQGQLERSAFTITAAESANVELERRIDAISGLVASPRKSDPQRIESAARRRHSRQKSLLPRFPTTGSLNLTARGPDGVPATPNLSRPLPARASSVDHGSLHRSLKIDVNHDALAALTGGAEAHSTPTDGLPSSNSSKRFSWATPDCYASIETAAVTTGTGRPSRRMRRFHAGTVMPKPLLLPSTASYAYGVALSAPVMERSESPPSFPFPELPDVAEIPSTRNFDFLLGPVPGSGRRRALTCIEDAAAAMRRASNPFLSPMPWPAAMATSSQRTASGTSSSCHTSVNVASVSSAPVGRNLFEELQLAATSVTPSDASDPPESIPMSRISSASSSTTQRPSIPGSVHISPSSSSSSSTTAALGIRKRAWTSHQRAISDQTGVHPSLEPSHFPDHDHHDSAAPYAYAEEGLLALVRDTFRQTYDTARQALGYAQDATIRSSTVERLQWWLVQVLLGPMMTSRMMAAAGHSRRPRQQLQQQQQRRRGSRRAPEPALELEPLPLLPPPHHRGGHGRTKAWVRDTTTTTGAAAAAAAAAVAVGRVADGRALRITWIQKHSPWLWIRFSLALLFAIGAALRDGPGVVLGIGEGEEEGEEGF